MIRHRPYGRGHPYVLEADQRVPAQPIAAEPAELRATTAADVDRVEVEIERDGVAGTLEAARIVPSPGRTSPGAQETHLSAAASSGGTNGRVGWRVELNGLRPQERIRYRFRAHGAGGGASTRWHEFVAADWQPDQGRLDVRAEGAASTFSARLEGDSIRWLVADHSVRRVRFALRLEADEHVVGFGERFNALDQRGEAIDAVVFEQYTQQGRRTYLPMPFAIVAGGGWGFHVVTARRVWFDVGRFETGRIWVEVDLDGCDKPHLDVELFAGEPADVLASFLELTGRPTLPPEWIFTPWMSGNEWNTQERVLAEVERGEREGIPAGVLVIEAWSDESTFTAFRDAVYEPHEDGSPHRLADFSFPPEGAWPDPKAMIDSLHERGLRLLLWQIPLLKAHPAPRGQLRHDRKTLIERGHAVRQANGRPYSNRGWWFPDALLPDFTSVEARRWWTAKRRYLVEELRVDGFKTDGGEHAWGHDLRYGDGTIGAETNNRYPVLYAAAYHELFAELGREGITFSRAGFTGSARYPCHWAGDESSTWEAFRSSITAGLTAGACGIFFWGWDFAGFSGEIPTAELYLRAAATACFCPIMQYHSEYNHHRSPCRDRTPWNIAERTGDHRVIPAYRRFARLRTKLVPYLSEQASRCVAESKPLMRAPFFEVADDERIWEFPFQYFLGSDMFVAPITAPGVSSLTVYLPQGDWVDPWTHEAIAGGRTIERPAPLDEIPVFIRAGRAEQLMSLFDDTRPGDRVRLAVNEERLRLFDRETG